MPSIPNMFAITLSQLVVFVLSAIVCGYVVEWVFKSRMPFGFLGAVVAGLVGIVFVVNVLRVALVPSIVVEGVPIVSMLAGATAGAVLWGLVGTLWNRRRPVPEPAPAADEGQA
ncbi:MAG: hypothetical protein KKA73_09975 [Chloroflexi bacterium]|nr:hypothetical protein [Chloroflexota bacterium]MBU1748004.1 hypothetical protein [Chloroflexota bacterium]